MRDSQADFQQSAALIRSSFERLFDALMEQSADRIYIKDTCGRFVFVSDALARTHGMDERHQLEGMSDFDFFTKENADAFYAEEQKILLTNKPIVNRIEKETWKDGKTSWASISKVPLQLESGVTIGILGISRDVTEEHLAKERLRQQNETMLADYASAEKVQNLMIPGRIPAVEGLELAYVWKPMTSVGGDIINFPETPNGNLLFFVGDVCGHGVQAAFYTILLKYITAQTAEGYQASPRDFLNKVGGFIKNRMDEGFVTAIAGHFGAAERDGSRVLHLSNAGSPDFLVYRSSDQSVEHRKLPSAMVMGLIEASASENSLIRLRKGDRFLAFTDGITETSNETGEEFGLQGLIDSLKETSSLPLQDALKTIYERSIKHSSEGRQQDDISILAFEIN